MGDEKKLVLDTRGRATFDLRFVGNDNMRACFWLHVIELSLRQRLRYPSKLRLVITSVSERKYHSVQHWTCGVTRDSDKYDHPDRVNQMHERQRHRHATSRKLDRDFGESRQWNPREGMTRTSEQEVGCRLLEPQIWDGGLILSEYLSSNPSEVGGKSCLELGAGTGIVGVCCYCLGASRVMITDLEEHVSDYQVELISANIEANAPLLSSMSAQGPKRNPKKDVQVAPLRWGENLQDFCRTTAADFDVILGSDIVYEPHCFAPLVETLRCLAGVGKKALIAHRPRHSEE
eukprot:763664-Hanusia_phi.AAC.10